MVVGIILAGGYGKRLKPITDYVPKPLVEIKEGYTILDKQILDLKYAGVDEVYLLVGYLWEKIKERYGDMWNGVKVNYLVEDEPRGTLWALRNAFSKLEEDTVVRNGDVVADFNIREMLERARKNENALLTIAVTRMRSPYGIIDFKDDLILSFREKPVLDYYINAGIYYIKKEAYEYFNREFTDKAVERTVFPLLAEMRKAYIFREDNVFWQSVDSLKDLERVREEYKSREDKPWGYEKMIILTDKYMVKELYIKKGYETSMHYHPRKDETMHIMYGQGYIEVEGEKKVVRKNDVFRIPPNKKHRIVAVENMLLYEYSTPHPDDTVRLQDPYER